MKKKSYIQEHFLRTFASGHRATGKRIASRLEELGIGKEQADSVRTIIDEELRGLFHGNLVIFDGGSELADEGLIRIIDEEGISLDSNLHEIGFEIYDEQI